MEQVLLLRSVAHDGWSTQPGLELDCRRALWITWQPQLLFTAAKRQLPSSFPAGILVCYRPLARVLWPAFLLGVLLIIPIS